MELLGYIEKSDTKSADIRLEFITISLQVCQIYLQIESEYLQIEPE